MRWDTGEESLRAETEGQPGAKRRDRSLMSGKSGEALWSRWPLSRASEGWIGFLQVAVGPWVQWCLSWLSRTMCFKNLP